MPRAPATCAASSRPARRSSFRRSKNSPSSSMRSATSSAGGASPSSSTKRTPAKAAAPARRCRRRSPRPARRGEEETFEDQINRLMESRKLLPNASYFAFTRHAQEQDTGDIRRAGAAARRQGQASRLPQLHHEAGDPGRLHPGRAGALHAGDEPTTSSPRRSRTTRSST